jgi:hypothetical protein
MLARLIRDFRQLRFALERYYRRRARRPLTPQEEAERVLAEFRRRQEALNRLMWRR